MKANLSRHAAASILPVAAVIAALSATPAVAQRAQLVPLKKDAMLKTAVVARTGPTGLRAGPTPTSIRLTWNCPQGATGYEVFATPTGGAPVKLTQAPLTNPCYQDLTLSIPREPRFPAPTQPVYITSFTHVGLAPAAEFVYVVRAVYLDGFGDSQPLTARAALWPAATGFVASLNGRSASLQWNPVAGAPGFLVFRKLEGQSVFQQLSAVPQTTTTFSDNTILLPGQHAYYVQTVSGQPTLAATLMLPPWPAPAGFGVTLSGRTASLTWGAIAGAPGYFVFRLAHGQSGFQQIATPPSGVTAFQDNALPLGTHQYYVQAVNGSASPTLSVVAGRPSGASVAIYRGKGTVDFNWSGTTDANVITLMRAPSPGGPYIDVTKEGNLARNSWARDDGATVGVTQYYKIIAVYYAFGPLESDVLAATIPVGPQGITNLVATSPGPGTVKISWTCDPEATGYGALRGKGYEAMDWIPFVMTKPCEFTDTGLWNGATYRYTITGRYPDRNTSTSAGVSVNIAP